MERDVTILLILTSLIINSDFFFMILRNAPAQKVSLEEDKHHGFTVWEKVGFLVSIIKVLFRVGANGELGFIGYRVSV